MPVLRSVKNIVKNYTDAEVKVREATSNDPWGPSSTLMAEIADLTYNVVAFTEIMQMIWRRLNDHGKNWRHVYKSLTLLEYIMKTGSEKVHLEHGLCLISPLLRYPLYYLLPTLGIQKKEVSEKSFFSLKMSDIRSESKIWFLTAKNVCDLIFTVYVCLCPK